MKNPLSLRVESVVGSIFVLLFTGFMLSLFFIIKKNAETEMDLLNVSQISIKSISPQERYLIIQWAEEKNITLPSDKSKIRFLIHKYPDRPWFSQ